ncbi:NAD(P)/FAD-dependent oxidoreductase [Alphaproteobacteria bacterium LSUCC0684]
MKGGRKTGSNVVVIGAGIVGVSCALQLAERNLSVTLVDRNPPCQETSYGNAGVISPWSCVPQSTPDVWRRIPRWLLDPEGPVFVRPRYLARFLPWAWRFLIAGRPDRIDLLGDAMQALSRNAPFNYRALLEGTNAVNLVRDSLYIFAYRNKEQADLGLLPWRMRQARDVPLSRIGRDELKSLEPDISDQYDAAIVIHDQARALDPAGIGHALAGKAKRLGISFRQAEVSAISRHDSSWSVHAGDGEIKAGHIVLAAGVWSARLLKPLGISLPLEAERGYHLLVRNAGVTINNSIMDTERMCVASQMEAGVRVAGTAEFAGIEAAPDYRRAEVFTESLKSLFPAINLDEQEPWMGRRPSFPDSLPCIGPVPGQPGLFAAFGHSHYGLSQAPKTGQIIADCLTGRKPDTDLAPYRIDRFR